MQEIEEFDIKLMTIPNSSVEETEIPIETDRIV